MALLNSHKLTLYEPTNRNNSFLKRRRKLIAKIDEQILLANDSDYKPTKIKWVHNEDGTERKLEIPKRVRLWWTETFRWHHICLLFDMRNKEIELD